MAESIDNLGDAMQSLQTLRIEESMPWGCDEEADDVIKFEANEREKRNHEVCPLNVYIMCI